jgi:hypothetical protein
VDTAEADLLECATQLHDLFNGLFLAWLYYLLKGIMLYFVSSNAFSSNIRSFFKSHSLFIVPFTAPPEDTMAYTVKKG